MCLAAGLRFNSLGGGANALPRPLSCNAEDLLLRVKEGSERSTRKEAEGKGKGGKKIGKIGPFLCCVIRPNLVLIMSWIRLEVRRMDRPRLGPHLGPGFCLGLGSMVSEFCE